MGRTRLSPQRCFEITDVNIGQIIIFCEGKTEKYYFDYFAEIIRKSKYNQIEVLLVSANGNAQTVLNCADQFLSHEENCQRFSTYGKYLAFDCDDPQDIQSVIKKSKNYELLISNYLFETWLLMHFEDVESKLSKRQIYSRLESYLHKGYSKGHKGKTREIIQKGDITKAIENARNLEHQYAEERKDISTDITKMNPYTSVYKLIEKFMVKISS